MKTGAEQQVFAGVLPCVRVCRFFPDTLRCLSIIELKSVRYTGLRKSHFPSKSRGSICNLCDLSIAPRERYHVSHALANAR